MSNTYDESLWEAVKWGVAAFSAWTVTAFALGGCDAVGPNRYSPKDLDEDGEEEVLVEQTGASYTVGFLDDEDYTAAVDGVDAVYAVDADGDGDQDVLVYRGNKLHAFLYDDNSYATDMQALDTEEAEELMPFQDDQVIAGPVYDEEDLE